MKETLYEEVGYWVILSKNGYRYMSFQCPICKIWVDGPVFVEEGSVHFMETSSSEAHEIVEITFAWQKRLAEEAEIAIDDIHIHVQMVNLDLDPDWPVLKRYGMTQFFLSGELVEEPVKVFLGEYDAVLIHLVPDNERKPGQLEEVILHELVHVAFPRASRKGKTSRKKSSGSVECEKWVDAKVKQLLTQHGYLVHSARATP